MNKHSAYTLADLARDFDLTERTARYYIENVLPPHHKTGRGKLARYGQDTWNCFAFIQLARERHGLKPGQVQPVLADLPQETIDRVVTGEEELAVMTVPTTIRPMRRASERAARYRGERGERGEAKSAPVMASLESDSEPDRLMYSMASEELAPPNERWHRAHADDRVRIDCRIEGELTATQREQIRTAAKLIRLALEA